VSLDATAEHSARPDHAAGPWPQGGLRVLSIFQGAATYTGRRRQPALPRQISLRADPMAGSWIAGRPRQTRGRWAAL